MKKIGITFILVLSLAICLCACGNGKVTDEDGFIGSEEELGQAADDIKKGAEDIKDKTEDLGNDVKEGAEKGADKVEDFGNDVKDGVKEGADKAKDADDTIIGDVRDNHNDGDVGSTDNTENTGRVNENAGRSAAGDDSQTNPGSLGVSAEARINLEQAKQAALADAGQSAKGAEFLKCYLENKSGKEYYDVEFNAAGSEYDYKIDAYTGQVIDKSWESIQ